MPKPPYPIIATSSPRSPRYTLLILGGLMLAAAGVAAVLMLRPAGALPDTLVVETLAPATVAAPVAASTPLLARPASVCVTCGTVEAVVASNEKGGKAGSAYQVQVRMDDGTLRSFSSATQPQRGAAVRVEGDGYRVMQRPS